MTHAGLQKMDICTKNISDQLSSAEQFGLRNTSNLSYSPIFGQLIMQTVRQCCVQHANGWTVLCLTFQWLVYAVYNYPMACEFSVQQSNGRTVLFPTVQWLDSPVSSCPMVRQCCVQQHIHSFTILLQSVQC